VAIIGASIPVLRVFLREKVSSYGGGSHPRSMAPSTLKHIPTTTTGTGRRSIALHALGPGKDKEGVWTRIEPIDETGGVSENVSRSVSVRSTAVRSSSRRASDEETGIAVSGDRGGSQEGIWQTTTISVEGEESPAAGTNRQGNSWLA
jgi:hypothetical protein